MVPPPFSVDGGTLAWTYGASAVPGMTVFGSIDFVGASYRKNAKARPAL